MTFVDLLWMSRDSALRERVRSLVLAMAIGVAAVVALLGFDLDDTAFLPTAQALERFDRDSVFEIQLSYLPGADAAEVVAGLKRILVARHGNEDFTVTTQQRMLDALSSVLGVLTFAVGALGSISPLVGGVGIFTIMTIGVRERTAEIGLLRALGARKVQVLRVFLLEAVALSVLGVASGLAITVLLDFAAPALPVSYDPQFMLLAVSWPCWWASSRVLRRRYAQPHRGAGRAGRGIAGRVSQAIRLVPSSPSSPLRVHAWNFTTATPSAASKSLHDAGVPSVK